VPNGAMENSPFLKGDVVREVLEYLARRVGVDLSSDVPGVFFLKQMIIKYNPRLKSFARDLRNKSTLSEVLLWNHLKGKKMLGYAFTRQKPLGDYIVDFYCHRLRLAIEIDGGSHFDKLNEDNSRQVKLEKMGIRFLRFGDVQVKMNMESVILEIEEWIKEEDVFLSGGGDV
jgi:very-short-patch-repair endonuclease